MLIGINDSIPVDRVYGYLVSFYVHVYLAPLSICVIPYASHTLAILPCSIIRIVLFPPFLGFTSSNQPYLP